MPSSELSYGLSGRLTLAGDGRLVLEVPNALGRGAFDALHEPGAELPRDESGAYRAHVLVMTPEELRKIGGPDAVTERGKTFRYTLGPVRSFVPHSRPGIGRCWFIEIRSPELERLRKSYGLPPRLSGGDAPFHVVFAMRRAGVQQNNDVAKRADWRLVPDLVRSRYQAGLQLQGWLAKSGARVADAPRISAYWRPEQRWLILVGPGLPRRSLELSQSPLAVKAATAPDPPPDPWNFVLVKRASPFGWLAKPYEWGGALTGGPSPLSNAIVTGLLLSGLGYGGGRLLEWGLPDKYFDDGALSRNLAILGALGGLTAGGAHLLANYGVMNRSELEQSAAEGRNPQPVGFWRALTTPIQKLNVSPERRRFLQDFLGDPRLEKNVDGGLATAGSGPPGAKTAMEAARLLFVKTAFLPDVGVGGVDGLTPRPVVVDQFNRAIWRDVQDDPYRPRTPPRVAAAVSGLVTGIQQLHGGAPLLSSRHFVRGLAAAGTDLLTANAAGRLLGALGGLNREGQRKLQEAGVWGGLMRGIAGSVLGVYD